MTAVDDPGLPAPYFHADSGAVRFWVATGDGASTGAIITKEILHYRFQGEIGGADAVATYAAHRAEIDAAVQRRIAAGSLEPVMLREADLGAAPRR